MDILQFTLVVVSATSIIVSVTLIALWLTGYGFVKRLQRIFDKLETISQTGVETSQSLKHFTENTTETLTKTLGAFATINGVKEVIHAVSDVMKKKKSEKES